MHCKAFPPPSTADKGLEIVYAKKKREANIFVLQLDGWYAENDESLPCEPLCALKEY